MSIRVPCSVLRVASCELRVQGREREVRGSGSCARTSSPQRPHPQRTAASSPATTLATPLPRAATLCRPRAQPPHIPRQSQRGLPDLSEQCGSSGLGRSDGSDGSDGSGWRVGLRGQSGGRVPPSSPRCPPHARARTHTHAHTHTGCQDRVATSTPRTSQHTPRQRRVSRRETGIES
eukprot:2795083-Rhodomonas_salina.1